MSSDVLNRPVVAEATREKFQRLAETLDRETAIFSNPRKRAEHPANLEIIAMGKEVVPLILADMEQTGEHWFSTLRAITGANPVGPEIAGKIPVMVKTWLDWAV